MIQLRVLSQKISLDYLGGFDVITSVLIRERICQRGQVMIEGKVSGRQLLARRGNLGYGMRAALEVEMARK